MWLWLERAKDSPVEVPGQFSYRYSAPVHTIYVQFSDSESLNMSWYTSDATSIVCLPYRTPQNVITRIPVKHPTAYAAPQLVILGCHGGSEEVARYIRIGVNSAKLDCFHNDGIDLFRGGFSTDGLSSEAVLITLSCRKFPSGMSEKEQYWPYTKETTVYHLIHIQPPA